MITCTLRAACNKKNVKEILDIEITNISISSYHKTFLLEHMTVLILIEISIFIPISKFLPLCASRTFCICDLTISRPTC